MTRIVNLRHAKYDVYIGRGSIWGNPFSSLPNSAAQFKVATREQSIESYRTWILKQPHLLAQLHTLKDKVLGCYCKPRPCHGDILIELINKQRR